MSRKRNNPPPNLTDKIAALLLTLRHINEHGQLEPIIPVEHARQMTAAQIASLFEWQHIFPDALGGTNHPVNLMPMLRSEHRKITRETDIPLIAKSKRLQASTARHRAKMLAKIGQTPETPPPTERRKVKVASRPFPKPPAGAKFDFRKGRYVMPQQKAAE